MLAGSRPRPRVRSHLVLLASRCSLPVVSVLGLCWVHCWPFQGVVPAEPESSSQRPCFCPQKVLPLGPMVRFACGIWLLVHGPPRTRDPLFQRKLRHPPPQPELQLLRGQLQLEPVGGAESAGEFRTLSAQRPPLLGRTQLGGGGWAVLCGDPLCTWVRRLGTRSGEGASTGRALGSCQGERCRVAAAPPRRGLGPRGGSWGWHGHEVG